MILFEKCLQIKGHHIRNCFRKKHVSDIYTHKYVQRETCTKLAFSGCVVKSMQKSYHYWNFIKCLEFFNVRNLKYYKSEKSGAQQTFRASGLLSFFLGLASAPSLFTVDGARWWGAQTLDPDQVWIQLCHSLGVWLWTRHLAALALSFPIRKKGLISMLRLWGLYELMYIKSIEQPEACNKLYVNWAAT